MISAFASRITGEALTTQRSATPKILFQFLHGHLDRRDATFVKKIEEFAALKAEHGGSLALGQSAFFEPAQYSGDEKFAREFDLRIAEEFDCFVGNFDCNGRTHLL